RAARHPNRAPRLRPTLHLGAADGIRLFHSRLRHAWNVAFRHVLPIPQTGEAASLESNGINRARAAHKTLPSVQSKERHTCHDHEIGGCLMAKQKNRHDTEPTVAPGIDGDEELNQKAT